MRIAIVSDIHANLEALEASLQDLASQNVDRILCLGDVVGYNASPAECIDLLRKNDVLCVAGNHDRAVAGQLSTDEFGYTAEMAVIWTRRQLDIEALGYLSALPTDILIPGALIAVHGALHPIVGRETVRLDTDDRLLLSFEALSAHPSRVHICAYGHTHQLSIHEFQGDGMRKLDGDQILLRRDRLYLVNPGAIGQPRTSDPRATYMILDCERNELSVHRVAYDVTVPFEKSRRAGLVPVWKDFPRPVIETLMRLPEPVRRNIRRGLRALRG